MQSELRLAISQMLFIEKQLAKTKQDMDSAAIKANVASIAGMVNKVNMANMASMAYVANTANNYQFCGTKLKIQLTGTNTTAYTLWKWAIKEKLRIDAIFYPIKIDRINHAFGQFTQLIFQQLEA